MGVPGLWDILRPTGEVHSLTHLAVQSGFVDNLQGHRAYRIGIDASIWFFHAQGGREGENPELRTLFFRCSRLLALPFLPIFVFDGPKRPKIKRGKAIGGKEHWMVNSLRTVLDSFGFECRTAPGEAEAELAYLNRIGVIDAVLSDDVDCFLFGANTVIRNSSATLSGNRSNGARNADGKEDGQHVHMYHSDEIEYNPAVKLSPGGLILIALLRGGDYDQQGIDGCGVSTAHALARAGFGDTLLTAARSPTPGALSAFLPTWRAALRHELSTNSSGLAPRKSPAVARRITEDFPRLDVLYCYTHPITSESERTGTRGLESLWKKRADVAKIAHVCELYFEWGVEKTVIKRFRSFLWPGAVLRTLLQAALEKDNRGRARVVTPSKSGKGGVETPSKALARTLGGLRLSADSDSDDEDFKLITAIHGERQHASTDNTLEYRLEIDPRELVARARSGVQGLRQELGDSAAAGRLDDDDDEDDDGEDGKKKKRGAKTPPPDPDSKLRLWMPAVMVQYVCPGLVRDYVERKAGKEAKKAKKGKTTKDKRRRKEEEEVEVEEEEESTPAKPVKSRKAKDTSTNAVKTRVSDEGKDTSNNSPPISKFRPSAAGKAAAIQVKSSLATATTSGTSGLRSQPKSATQLLDEDLFWTPSLPHKFKSRTKQARSGAERLLIPRPFPLDSDDLSTESKRGSSPIFAPSRKHGLGSASSRDAKLTPARLEKSPRKSSEHSSPRALSEPLSPSPSPRRFQASQMKPLHRAFARSAASKAAVDEVIVISSDSDESPPRKTKAKGKYLSSDSDESPPRKTKAKGKFLSSDSDESPPRQTKAKGKFISRFSHHH